MLVSWKQESLVKGEYKVRSTRFPHDGILIPNWLEAPSQKETKNKTKRAVEKKTKIQKHEEPASRKDRRYYIF